MNMLRKKSKPEKKELDPEIQAYLNKLKDNQERFKTETPQPTKTNFRPLEATLSEWEYEAEKIRKKHRKQGKTLESCSYPAE